MDTFLAVSAASSYHELLRGYADSWLQQGCTRPEWCVLGMEGGAPLVRAALWAQPGQSVPTDLVLLDADWTDHDLSAGRALLSEVHARARSLGADSLHHHVDSPPGPPQYQERDEERVRLITGSGYELLRDGLRWLWSAGPADGGASQPSLTFRTLAEVGEDAFIAAMASTYEGTLDTWIARRVDELGRAKAARSDFLEYQTLEHRPEWWELASTGEDELVGVVMAARNPSSAVIAYVGVVPAQRGRGLAEELVRRGMRRLVSDGASEIRGDCDQENVGMVKAFERAGFTRVARRRTYQVRLVR
ncbi:MAG: GNAT family N-acetyltransferase [Candidatus Dormibacteraeota bacterium]|nr:GNAT family N-acetyltransferase [Candidatus Dormibacteraeota bacterium]